MLHLRDILLTLAALCLLNAALESKSRVIRASASQTAPPEVRKSDAAIDRLMLKVRHSLERSSSKPPSQQTDRQRPAAAAARADPPQEETAEARQPQLSNSYHYYANRTSADQAPAPAGYTGDQQLQQVARQVQVKFLRSAPGKRRPAEQGAPLNHSLYLLKLPAGHSLDSNEIDTGEQQQAPPLFLGPPQTQQQQQPLSPLNGLQMPNSNIRQILSNYQRYPQAAHERHAAIGANLRARPSGQLPGQQQPQQQQQQQQLSPLHFLTAPLQALLPALGQAGAGSGSQAGGAGSLASSPGRASGGSAASQPQFPPAVGQLPGLLRNPFAGQQQPQQSGAPVANLQALYQQLPLYQALLAARQRQEALLGAERVRQQQQQQQHLQQQQHQQQQQQQQQQHLNLENQAKNQQPAVFPFAAQPGLASAPFLPQLLEQLRLAQLQQQQQPQPLPVAPQFPVAGVAPTGAAAPVEQQQPPLVQFDDEPGGQPPAQANGEPAGGGQADAEPASPASEGQPEEPAEEQPNEQAPGGGGGGGAGEQAAGAQPEEEDPDLKQFQNLANGADSFTDLFPPGILSNNDISDIKKQQEEQARRQEEEERQKQLQQQQQQPPPPPQQQQPAQFQQDQPAEPGAPIGPAPGEAEGEAEREPADQESPEADGRQEEPEEADQGQPEAEGGEQEAPDSPTAAALTGGKAPARLAQSPGVVYG